MGAVERNTYFERFKYTQKSQSIMKGTVFLLAIIGLHSVTSLPSISIDEQTKKCYSAFYRCCSSETEIPQRCFEMNNCVLNFNSLRNYNIICHGIYPQKP